MVFPDVAFQPLLPLLILLATGVFATLGGFFVARQSVAYVSLAGILATLFSLLALWSHETTSFAGALRADHYALAFSAVILIGAFLTVLVSLDSAKVAGLAFHEFDALLLFGLVGTLLIAFAGDLIVLLIGIEVMSLATYVLVTVQESRRSEEAGMKYFLLGAIGSAILIYGMALVFGAAGSFDLAKIASSTGNPMLLGAGAMLMLIGFGFKVGLVPFHQWTPDVYSGSPTLVTFFMSIVIKTAAFAGFLRVFSEALPPSVGWVPVLQVLIVITVLLGNLAALRQTDLKRMLAYSAVAHSGYLALALLVKPVVSEPAMVFYLLSYTIVNAGVFGVMLMIQRNDDGLSINDLRGLYYRRPGLAVALALCLASLAGLPPMAGFIGKYLLFSAAFSAGYVGVTVCAVVGSMIAFAYYLRPAMQLFMQSDTPLEKERLQPFSAAAVALCAFGVLILGLVPNLLYTAFGKM